MKYTVKIARCVLLLITNTVALASDPCPSLVPLGLVNSLSNPTSQILIVKSLSGFQVDITACELQGENWTIATPTTFPGVIGKNGMAVKEEKQEGDWKTPTGLFSIGDTFGTEPLAIKMNYKYITADDKFIDDPTSPQYNTWVTGETDAKSYENMLFPLYKLGAVIQYNVNPTIPGKGSAIFLHIWRFAESPTAGCVAMDEWHLSVVLNWFDKSKHPTIYITE